MKFTKKEAVIRVLLALMVLLTMLATNIFALSNIYSTMAGVIVLIFAIFRLT